MEGEGKAFHVGEKSDRSSSISAKTASFVTVDEAIREIDAWRGIVLPPFLTGRIIFNSSPVPIVE